MSVKWQRQKRFGNFGNLVTWQVDSFLDRQKVGSAFGEVRQQNGDIFFK